MPRKKLRGTVATYGPVLKGMVALLEDARRTAVRATNVVMTATYWEVGRRIVEHEQSGEHRADYGAELMERLAKDLTARFGRGFGKRNLFLMRGFYLAYPNILQTLSARSEDPIKALPAKGHSANMKLQTVSARSERHQNLGYFEALSEAFPLPWSHYVQLLSVEDVAARKFYSTEALRGGWSVRQLDRQISTRFYERTARSRNKLAMLRAGSVPQPGEEHGAEDAFQDPFLLEFADLPDRFTEGDLEDALIRHMEHFLLELGGDFAFIGRQRRLRVGHAWYRVDLLFFHRKLRCLVIIDLKVGRFTHADAGQMNLYLNYARSHWTNSGENPPVGLILCTRKDEAVARYALDGITNSVLASEYKLLLPDVKQLQAAIAKARKQLDLIAQRKKKRP